jgi:hypothetical protein
VTPRTKQKTNEKPASPKAAVAKLVPPPQGDIDDDADDRQRVGVQSLGRAFAILEEVARHREGIGLADGDSDEARRASESAEAGSR